jgi:hypothetical protein
MNRLFVPTTGVEAWRRLLADPDNQWKKNRSAFECATSWEAARGDDRGLPRAVAAAFDSPVETRGAVLLFGIPEHQVEFKGGGHASQTDFFALLGVRDHTISVAFEAKAGEALGERVGNWLAGAPAGSGKPARLLEIRDLLGLEGENLESVRYQLLHRTASAVKEGRRFRSKAAALVILSFGGASDDGGYEDYCEFGRLMGASVNRGQVTPCARRCATPLLVGWVDCAVS